MYLKVESLRLGFLTTFFFSVILEIGLERHFHLVSTRIYFVREKATIQKARSERFLAPRSVHGRPVLHGVRQNARRVAAIKHSHKLFHRQRSRTLSCVSDKTQTCFAAFQTWRRRAARLDEKSAKRKLEPTLGRDEDPMREGNACPKSSVQQRAQQVCSTCRNQKAAAPSNASHLKIGHEKTNKQSDTAPFQSNFPSQRLMQMRFHSFQ